MKILDIALLFAVCFGAIPWTHSSNSEFPVNSIKLCGYDLTKFVIQYCGDRGVYSAYRKRSENSIENETFDYEDYDKGLPAFRPDFSDDIFNSNQKEMVNDRLKRFEKIVEECCNQPCSINSLRSYCQ